MKIKDNFKRLMVLLLITLIACIALYWLPDSLLGQKIKKVDLLSDIRIQPTSISLDSLRAQLENDFIIEIDSTYLIDSLTQSGIPDARTIAVNDSLKRVINGIKNADPAGMSIEDYSNGHTGLKRFFTALNNREQLDRPVRIAFMGDSFIEGDIVVADFRNEMQKQFGGRGVGFVPITSIASQFRPTINQKAEGWKTYSLINNKNIKYSLSGQLFEAKSDKATLSFETAKLYNRLKQVSSLKFLYEKNEHTSMQLSYNGSADTITYSLPATETITQYILNDTINEAHFSFVNAKGFQALGIALEDNRGIIVDNYSLRGNSGLLLEHFDPDYCKSFSNIRPYDLIILQYGLNAIDESMLEYGWYRVRMIEVIEHLKRCFPDTDILLLSISDRANQYNGEFSTMPAVLAFLHTQRQVARAAKIPFWNMFGAMGGENSIVTYVDKGWASKDYTHMSFRGGREIAKKLMNVLMEEKEHYNEAE